VPCQECAYRMHLPWHDVRLPLARIRTLQAMVSHEFPSCSTWHRMPACMIIITSHALLLQCDRLSQPRAANLATLQTSQQS